MTFETETMDRLFLELSQFTKATLDVEGDAVTLFTAEDVCGLLPKAQEAFDCAGVLRACRCYRCRVAPTAAALVLALQAVRVAAQGRQHASWCLPTADDSPDKCTCGIAALDAALAAVDRIEKGEGR